VPKQVFGEEAIMCIPTLYDTHHYPEIPMRTNIVIDDELMKQALTLSGLKTKREAVEEGLKLLIVMKKQAKIRELRGALTWEGDLDAMRSDA
jgi:Arc/MetJ family transcription regulator